MEISLIISTFNRIESLKKTIQSVLNQNFDKDFEVIVVDDCSIDGTEEMMRKWQDKRLKYIRLPKNCGFDSKPKNIGIANASGRYICFLDDDDIYRKDALRVLYNQLNNSDFDVVYGDYIYNYNGKRQIGWSLDFNAQILEKMNFIAMSVVMVKREALIDVGGFNEEIKKFKDWNLWVRLNKAGYNFRHIPLIITEVYFSDSCISKRIKTPMDEQGRFIPTFDIVNCLIYADKTCLGKEKMPKVAIYTLTKDRLDYTKRTFESMKKTAGYNYDHFIVDQGSTDGTVEWLVASRASFREVIFNKLNVGISKGSNQAVGMIKGYEIIIKTDNDCDFLTEDWLKDIVEIYRRNRMFVLSPYVEGLRDNPGGVLRQSFTSNSPYIQMGDYILGLVPHLGGLCCSASASAYKDFKWEENDFYSGIQDYVFSQHCLQRGYVLAYLETQRVEHMDMTLGQHKKFPEYFELHKKEATTKYEEI